MNREIKFKVWWKDRIKGGIWSLPFGIDERINELDGAPPYDAICEFTGIKDKNGKDIYEGDIVKIVFNDVENYEIGEVVFTGGYFHIDGSLLDDTQEIIGNIYENPELLN